MPLGGYRGGPETRSSLHGLVMKTAGLVQGVWHQSPAQLLYTSVAQCPREMLVS